MNIETAEALVRKRMSMQNKQIESVSESQNYFIFAIVSVDKNGVPQRTFTPPMAVHKRTSRLVVFNPPDFPEELSSIRRIR